MVESREVFLFASEVVKGRNIVRSVWRACARDTNEATGRCHDCVHTV